MLLLYALLHGCSRFHEYCLVRATAFVCTVFQSIQYVLTCCTAALASTSSAWRVHLTPV